MKPFPAGALRAFGLVPLAFALAVVASESAEKKGGGGKKSDPGLAPGDAGGEPAGAPKTYEPPAGAKPYEAPSRPMDGRHLQAAIRKLVNADGASKPFVFCTFGSSYTNRLGAGEEFKALIRAKFPKAPELVVKRFWKAGASYREILPDAGKIAAEKPDLVLVYTFGAPADIERIILALRAGCSAEIMVPSTHWTGKEKSFWDQGKEPPGVGTPGVEKGMSTNWGMVRDVCEKQKVEFVDSRNEIAEWMRANKVQPGDLLVDAVHQKPYLANMIRMSVVRHLNPDFKADAAAPVPANPPATPPANPPAVTPPTQPPATPPTTPPANPPANPPATPPPATPPPAVAPPIAPPPPENPPAATK